MPLGIAASHSKGSAGNIQGEKDCAGERFCQGNGNAPRASANIGNAQSFAAKRLTPPRANFTGREAVESNFDDVFSLRARDQHLRRDFEFEAPEFLFPGQMLGRFARRATANERRIARSVHCREFFFGMGIDPGAVAAQNVKQQQFRGKRAGRHMGITELRDARF